MAPIVKDVENSAAIPAGAAPANKAPQDASATRPQPVALEIPVTVNGARTLEGSDKREPFSESTQTVLVFAHGAVIRLASLVSPGQLLFVTNEKTKKEVVCQVVKSKNYRTVTGYVELEFTEPAAGFWGMRFPAERVAPIPAPAGVPAAPSSTPRPVAPVSTLTPIPAKVVAPLAAPVAEKPATPTPLPTRPISIAAPVAPPTVAKPPASKPDQPVESLSEPQIAQQQTPAPAAPVISPQTVVPAPPVSLKSEPIPVPELHAGSLAPTVSSSAGSDTKSATPQATKSEPTLPAANPTTEDLKQQAERLQEQLKSLLFTQAPTAKASSPEPPVSPKPEIIPTETVQKIIQLAPPDVKPSAPVSTPVQESKPAPLTLKSVPLSMEVEEVKVPTWLKPSMRETEPRPPEPVNIPAWLAPLIRDPEPSRAQGANEAAIVEAPEAISSASPVETDSLVPDGEHGSTAQATIFGGQLLGSSLADGEASTSDSSKKRLFLGMAAAGMLLIASGAWYAKQPGSVLSGLFAAKPAAPQTSQNSPAPVSQPAFRTDAAAPPSSAVTPLNQAPPSKTITPLPAASSAVNSAPVPAVVKETTSAPRNEPAVELRKKPVFGEVHLATPNVNRPGTTSENGDAPSIDAGQTSAAEPLEDLGGSRSKAPKAPLPIGGDVIPAKLLKSVPPIYPPTARSQRIAGDVKIDALVDASGNVSTMKVIAGPPLLHQAAMMALKQWKYEPAKLDGNATAMHLTVTVQFRLQ
jgi:periplasmic protein TonB